MLLYFKWIFKVNVMKVVTDLLFHIVMYEWNGLSKKKENVDTWFSSSVVDWMEEDMWALGGKKGWSLCGWNYWKITSYVNQREVCCFPRRQKIDLIFHSFWVKIMSSKLNVCMDKSLTISSIRQNADFKAINLCFLYFLLAEVMPQS